MKMMDTRAYVGMLKELVEQGREVRMVISGSSMAPFLIHGRDSIFFRAPGGNFGKVISYFTSGRADSLSCIGSAAFMQTVIT